MKENNKKILVLAPHADDEVLGCAGYLLHQLKKGAEVYIVIATIGGSNRLQNFQERFEEFQDVLKALHPAKGTFLYKNMDAELDKVSTNEFVGKLDEIVDSFRPNEVFINYPSHHQDHKKLYDCAVASLRLRNGYAPDLVALYEYPFINIEVEGCKCYHDIEDVIEEKCSIFSLYKSQVKPSPSPLNSDGIKAIANFRGVQSGMKYAELFYVQQMKIE